jgi:transposase
MRGLIPQPYDSSQSHVDQGIRRVRTQLVEMAWCWLRYQPDSALAQWFNKRTQGTKPNRRGRRIAIVALARRLMIALWRSSNSSAVGCHSAVRYEVL